jgi:hypothetical protein
MAIHVTIDELVLHGVDRRDRDAIAEAIRQAIVEGVSEAKTTDAARTFTVRETADVARTFTVRDSRPAKIGSGAGRAIAAVISGGNR